MEFLFKGISVVRYKYKEGDKSSTHLDTKFSLEAIRLEPSENLDRSFYFEEDGMPKAAAIKPMTQCFVQGLVGNIHTAHQLGHWDSAEHLRYIISELERGFIQPANVEKSEF